jgi:hypothetical protein
LGVPSIIVKTDNLDLLFDNTSKFKLCFGCTNEKYGNVKIPLKHKNGNIKTQITTKKTNGKDVLAHRSLKCELSVDKQNATMCKPCGKIRKHFNSLNLMYEKENVPPVDHKDELKKEKKREKYWKNKAEFEKHSRLLCEQDNKDLEQVNIYISYFFLLNETGGISLKIIKLILYFTLYIRIF